MKCGVIAIVDGVNHSTFKKLLKKGKLPFIEEISKDSYFIEKCYTVFPSATVTGHASISTGSFPSKHGLVGQAWFDREKQEYIGYDFELTLPDNWIDASTNLNDQHIQTKTGFEIAKELGLKTFSVDLIRKGADLKMSFITPGVDRGVGFASKLFFLRKFASYNAKKKKSIIKKILLKLIPFHVFQHEIAVLNTLKAIKSGYRFGVTWFMETDAASHLFGPESFEGSEGKPYLYDSVEDALIDADSELEKLYKKLSDYKPIFAVVTDHGHSTLGKDKRYHTDLTVKLEERGLNALTNLDPKEYERKTKKKAEVVVAPSGPRMAHIYVLTERQRVFEALRDIESVEFIFFREGDRIFVSDSVDVYDLEEYEFGDEYPKAFERVTGLMFNERCGDFVITAKKGYEFQISDYRGAHGGLNFEDSTGFAIIHCEGLRERVIPEGFVTDVLPMTLKLLVGQKLFYSSVQKKLISTVTQLNDGK